MLKSTYLNYFRNAGKKETAEMLEQVLEHVPEEWRPVIAVMLDKNPAKRPNGFRLVSRLF